MLTHFLKLQAAMVSVAVSADQKGKRAKKIIISWSRVVHLEDWIFFAPDCKDIKEGKPSFHYAHTF